MTYYTCSRDPYTDCRYCLGYLESLVNTHRHSYLIKNELWTIQKDRFN